MNIIEEFCSYFRKARCNPVKRTNRLMVFRRKLLFIFKNKRNS